MRAAIYDLSCKTALPKFEKALVGIHVFMPHGVPHIGQTWDASNRAVNLIINNLKGAFFPDDDIEHLIFAVAGAWSERPKTIIYIGDCCQHSSGIMQLLNTSN